MAKYRHIGRVYFPKDEFDYLLDALMPETGEIRRCSVHWEASPPGGALVIRAEDIHSLRAALNSYMRWANVALGVFHRYRRS